MILEPDETGVIMTLEPAHGRRLFAIGALYLLGALILWIALAQPPAPGWAIFLIVMGALSLLGGESLRRATTHRIELTRDGLFDSAGRELALWADMERVERGLFAFKPSNGFLVVRKSPGPRVWAPGLWWRIGRRVGVGGVTSQQPARFMAEQIAMRLEIARHQRAGD